MDRTNLLQLFTPSFLTAFQQKLFISILAKLPTDNKSKNVVFQFKASSILLEIEEKLSYKDLQKEMFLFVQKTYRIDETNELIQVSLISRASFIKGKGIIEIEMNSAFLPYLYQLKQVFPLNTLRQILMLKSIHSINIYLLLSGIDNDKSISYAIEKLKVYLGIEKKYIDYNSFKNRVLLQAQKELHLTDKAFFFKEEKYSRKITHITFKVYPFDQLYWTNHRQYLMRKLVNELEISEVQASRIVFQFVEEEIHSNIYHIKEKQRAGQIKTSLAAYSVSLFNQKKTLILL
jgi:plasmid replication initiation protein